MKRITDKMRLDWLLEHRQTWGLPFRAGGKWRMRPGDESPLRTWGNGTTPRKAIDAAIAASKRGRGKRG